MMSLLLTPIIQVFNYTLQPVAPFTWFNLSISTLDVVAAFRLCVVLRQIKESLYRQHVSKNGVETVAPKAFARDVSTTLTVVYGGEACHDGCVAPPSQAVFHAHKRVPAPLLCIPPSFMVSGVVPVLYTAVQAIVEMLPSVPEMTIHTELPLSVVDGFTRALLLCNLIPPAVTTNASPLIAASPWTLLVTSLVTANGGFFLTNLFSFLNPTPIAVQTPPELQPYGWTATDLWCAPLVTGIYALLTHAQPFWAELHTVLSGMLGGEVATKSGVVEPLDPHTARAVCAVVLTTLFVTRTVKNFAPEVWNRPTAPIKRTGEKLKTQ
ncbi:hypothetical protein MSAN_01040500 [Mycena sanguinolenta]|uniref:Uncharacterized protein n=1 Tax=Mycena sanguinolenta TaxID=230812 RepID=A0A8H6YS47_9AGAR|nr:hypothetical protein MSAN_01040500 [Mycena sanguinolenta]